MSDSFGIYLDIGNRRGMHSEMVHWSLFSPNMPIDMCLMTNGIGSLY